MSEWSPRVRRKCQAATALGGWGSRWDTMFGTRLPVETRTVNTRAEGRSFGP
jgi:hypothetical protein